MNRSSRRATAGRALRICGVLAVALVCAHTRVDAQNAQTITRIEEDWRIEFGTPDTDLNAPQITMTMSPYSDLSGPHAVFEINHSSEPQYSPGGLQMQRWNGDTLRAYANNGNNSVLQIPNDVATFTMSMDVSGGTLAYGISNGNSQTWGTFGNDGALNLASSHAWSNLSSYDPTTSLNNSYVGWGSNRVQRVLRTAVRYYAGGVLVNTDSTSQVIYQYTDGN